jgi:2-C-methyl-D-erythritol 2,4-cyclodiphosphate synthase
MVRTGLGIDTHPFAPGRPLILGGVHLPHEQGLAGHSDADVLTHAVIDALLGAAGLGDIGVHFPDTDPRLEGADSLGLLRTVVADLGERGWEIGNVDATVVLERPKLGAYRDAIRSSLARALGLPEDAVNVKATTGERMGFVGRGEGAAALAVATIDGRARNRVPGTP